MGVRWALAGDDDCEQSVPFVGAVVAAVAVVFGLGAMVLTLTDIKANADDAAHP